jgi:prolyl-tRNA synthetase
MITYDYKGYTMSQKQLPDITTHFAEWYQEIVHQAELADHAPVRGCMVVRPYGYALWEHIKARLDQRIKETGHQNAAFPLLIPESFLKKEAQHVEGFSPELAVVTHAGGKELEEPLVVRPTSETIIHYMYAQWLKSWRDLPILIIQWANVVRWEMRPRPFLRTTEFFWQEGHTAHETQEEALQESLLMLEEYVNLAQDYLAIPVIKGVKSEKEKFPGADKTHTFEGIMPDGKALQMGTSHLISQSFAKAFNMTFQDRQGNMAYPYLTSWGATTRLVGAVVMMHGDQKGLVLPPRIAPYQVVIVPILKKGEEKAVLDACNRIKEDLVKVHVRVHIDADDQKTPGAKFYHWEMKGVPLRLEIGPRDLAQNQVIATDRIGLGKKTIALAALHSEIPALLEEIQKQLFARAQEKQKSLWHKAAKLVEFGPKLEAHNGVYQTGWCQDRACEDKLCEYKATTRCLIPEKTFEFCFNCNKPSKGDVLVAKAY